MDRSLVRGFSTIALVLRLIVILALLLPLTGSFNLAAQAAGLPQASHATDKSLSLDWLTLTLPPASNGSTLTPNPTISLSTCNATELVSAINTANSTPGGNVIQLKAGCIYSLMTRDNTDATYGDNGLPAISSTITINGNGATIARSSADAFRISMVNTGATLSLNNVTITGGSSQGPALKGTGGAILNLGTLNVTNSTLYSNTVGYVGAGISNWGTAQIISTTLSANRAATNGGGLDNEGTATVTNSTFSGNSATQYGGGIDSDGPSLTVTGTTFYSNTASTGGGLSLWATGYISNSTVYSNTADVGAGISNWGTVQVISTTLSGNNATTNGGGLDNEGTATVTNSTFSGNSAAQYGGGIDSDGSSLTVTGSTFSNNTATDGAGLSGNSIAYITNSTFSGNAAVNTGGGIFNSGAVSVLNSTIAGNSAPGGGGGVYNYASNVLTVTNSLLSGNTTGGNCGGTIPTNGGHNLDSGACGFTLVADPKLGPLANNGGATWTMALNTGSPAIDAGSNGACPATDQRGMPRPQGPTCDIGAYERGLTGVVLASSGTPQTSLIGSAFGLPLQATVKDPLGLPLPGITVTFTAPAVGASGFFPGPSTTVTATTSASGVAATPTFTANSIGGSYVVTASVEAVSATYALTNIAPVVGVSISGPATGLVQNGYSFTATVNPTATLPVTYSWQTTGLYPITRTGGGLSDTVSFTWAVTGTKTITVTATNSAGTASGTYSITISSPTNSASFKLYLPAILKDYSGG